MEEAAVKLYTSHCHWCKQSLCNLLLEASWWAAVSAQAHGPNTCHKVHLQLLPCSAMCCCIVLFFHPPPPALRLFQHLEVHSVGGIGVLDVNSTFLCVYVCCSSLSDGCIAFSYVPSTFTSWVNWNNGCLESETFFHCKIQLSWSPLAECMRLSFGHR